jgi:hypothetical protein
MKGGGQVRRRFHLYHRITSFCSSLLAKGFRISPAEETDLDFPYLEKLRKRLETTDVAAFTLVHLPDTYSGSLPDDTGRRADSFLSRYMTAVKKDIEDMLRDKTKEDL